MLNTVVAIFLSVLGSEQTNSCALPNEELIQQYLVMEMENRTVPLMVPERFLEDAHDLVQGRSHGAQLFRLDTDTFEPVSRKETGVQLNQGRRDYLSLLIRDFIDLEKMLRTRFNGFKATNPDAYTKNFEFELHSSDFNIIVGGFAPKNGELFFFGPSDNPEIVAQCKVLQYAKFQSCTLHFASFGLEVKMTVDKRKFDRWKEIKAGVDGFLACLTSI